jgi:hypothetical protein
MPKRLLTLLPLALLIVVAIAPAATASGNRFEVPITGDQFECGSTTWTVTEGFIDVKERIGPGQHLSVSIRPVGAFAEDADGNRVKLVGAESVSRNTRGNGEEFTHIFHLNLVSQDDGGLVGRVAQVFHVSANDNHLNITEHDTGGCDGPIRP